MCTFEEPPKRKKNRAPNYNYNSNGVYFLTICILNREHVLGRIVGTDDPGGPSVPHTDLGGPSIPHSNLGGPDVSHFDHNDFSVSDNGFGEPFIELSECGIIVENTLKETSKHYPEIFVDKYVIMPNHLHILLRIDDCEYPLNTAPRGHIQTNNVSRFVTALKKFSNKQIGENIWQNRFHDHIIRDKEDYLKHWKYIEENPVKWLMQEDEYY